MPRPQFSLKTMLWLMAPVGAFLAGMVAHRALMDHERRAVQQHEKAVLDYQETLNDYVQRLRNPTGGIRGSHAYFDDGWSVDQKTGLLLPPSPDPPIADESAEDSPAKEDASDGRP